MKILLAADGSPCTEAAARYIVDHLERFAQPEVHVMHVCPPIASRAAVEIGTVEGGRAILREYPRAESEAALEAPTRLLRDAGVAFKASWSVGEVAEELDRYVRGNAIDLIVMGSHGRGALTSLVLGSVTRRCITRLATPILVVPAAAAAQASEPAAA